MVPSTVHLSPKTGMAPTPKPTILTVAGSNISTWVRSFSRKCLPFLSGKLKPGNNKYAHLIENGTLEKNSAALSDWNTPTEGEIYFALGDGSTMVENKTTASTRTPAGSGNTWNHYILSYNGNVVLLYQNGALVD